MSPKEELEALRRLAELEAKQAKSAKTQVDNDPITKGAKGFAADMGFGEKFAAGAGKAVSDIGLGIRQLTGNAPQSEVDERKRLDAPLMDTGAGMAGNVAGNVAMAVAPGLGVAGTGTALGAKGVQAVGRYALTAPATVAGAATQGALGAAQSFVQPVATGESRAANTMLGGAAGGAVPVAGMALKSGKAAIEPFYESGRNQILARALRRTAGDEADAVAQRLARATELVPGSAPTIGQAAENPGIAALERSVVAIEPSATNLHGQRLAQQGAARTTALEDMAGTQGARDAADVSRRAASNSLYENAYLLGIDPIGAGVSPALQKELNTLFRTPALKDALGQARVLAANEGINLKNAAGQVKGLDYVKRALDDQIGNATGNEQRILTSLKERFLSTVDQLSPEYAQARQTFQQASKPINQMDVAQELLNKSADPMTGNIRPQAYARALSDDTAQRATGFGGATLQNTMTPQQMALLDALKADLARSQAAQNAGRGPGSDTIQKLAYANFVDAAGVPTFLRNMGASQAAGNIASRGADVLYGRANRELTTKLGAMLLNPNQAGRLMQDVVPSEAARRLALALRAGGTPLAIGAAPAMLDAPK